MKRRVREEPPVLPDRARVRALIAAEAAAKLADRYSADSTAAHRALVDLAGFGGAYALVHYDGDRPLTPDELERATDWAIEPRGNPWTTFEPSSPSPVGRDVPMSEKGT